MQKVIECSALPAFHILLRHHKPNIQKEGAWAISNITAGNTNQIQAVIDSGIIPLVIEVLARVSLRFLYSILFILLIILVML